MPTSIVLNLCGEFMLFLPLVNPMTNCLEEKLQLPKVTFSTRGSSKRECSCVCAQSRLSAGPVLTLCAPGCHQEKGLRAGDTGNRGSGVATWNG